MAQSRSSRLKPKRFCADLKSQSAHTADLANKPVNVFRRDPVGDHRAWVVRFEIEMKTVFASGTDKLLNKVHAAARFYPAVVGVDVVGLHDDVEFEENRTVQRQITK